MGISYHKITVCFIFAKFNLFPNFSEQLALQLNTVDFISRYTRCRSLLCFLFTDELRTFVR
jgi:hypothetical protein